MQRLGAQYRVLLDLTDKSGMHIDGQTPRCEIIRVIVLDTVEES